MLELHEEELRAGVLDHWQLQRGRRQTRRRPRRIRKHGRVEAPAVHSTRIRNEPHHVAYASPRLSTGAIKVVNSKEAAVRVPSKVVGGEVHSQLRALDAGRSCVARIARAGDRLFTIASRLRATIFGHRL